MKIDIVFSQKSSCTKKYRQTSNQKNQHTKQIRVSTEQTEQSLQEVKGRKQVRVIDSERWKVRHKEWEGENDNR